MAPAVLIGPGPLDRFRGVDAAALRADAPRFEPFKRIQAVEAEQVLVSLQCAARHGSADGGNGGNQGEDQKRYRNSPSRCTPEHEDTDDECRAGRDRQSKAGCPPLETRCEARSAVGPRRPGWFGAMSQGRFLHPQDTSIKERRMGSRIARKGSFLSVLRKETIVALRFEVVP